jgi:hypothetical protein
MVTGHHKIRLRESGSGIERRRNGDDYRCGYSGIVSEEYLHSEGWSYNDCHRVQRQLLGEIQDWNDDLKDVG